MVVLTEKWAESARMLQILCLWGAFMPIQSMFTNLLVSCGRTNTFMWSSIAQGVLVLLMLLAMRSLGIKPMLLAYCLFNIAWLFLWCVLVKRDIALTIRMFVADFLPFMLVALAAMLLAAYATMWLSNLALLLVSRVLLGAVFYFVSCFLCRFEELRESVAFLLRRKNNKE